MTETALELGLHTFGDVTVDADGAFEHHAVVHRHVVAEAELADALGLDFFGVGEHHRIDYAVSAPEVLLGAIAGRTRTIRLGTAVTVLSSDDPVRVYQRFATLDAVSEGRAEIMLGRGSFTESFPLFGYAMADYEKLFDEKLELFDLVRRERPVTWSGTTRAPLEGKGVYPVTERGTIPTWVGVGGSPNSVVRAARYGFPVVFAVIGGSPARFAPLAELYREALAHYGHQPQPLAIHSPGYVSETDEQAAEEYWPHWSKHNAKIGRERGWGPATRAGYDLMSGPGGALFVGSPETVADKIVDTVRTLGLSRFDLKYSLGTLPHEALMRCIQLYGERVAPLVREKLADA